MEGNNDFLQGLQGDVSYDELINNAGWPSSGDPFVYQQQAHPAQDAYPRYPTSQTPLPLPFDQYNLSQQPSYAPPSFSNSPYTSQYQHARPSDVFGPTSYNVDPALQAYPGSDSSFSFNNQENSTISPHSLQYPSPSNQPVSRATAAANALFQRSGNTYNQSPQDQTTLFHSSQNSMLSAANPLRYPTLPDDSSDYNKAPNTRNFDIVTPANAARPQSVQPEPVPDSLRITNSQLLAAKNSSSRPRLEHAPFLAWDDTPIQVAPSLKNTIPKYHPRKSKSGRELISGFDVSRISTPARLSTKKIRVPKEKKASVGKYKGTSQAPKQASRVANLRDSANSSISVKSPTPTDTSSSEEEISSEEESEYEEDEVIPPVDISTVREMTRPTNPVDASRWDAIGVVWKDPNSSPNNDIVKAALEEYGDLVNAIRVKIKTNAAKAAEAAARPAEIATLTTERSLLLDQLYETVSAAYEHGHESIVMNLGKNQKLAVALQMTLMDCLKANDYLGKLPRVIFNLFTKFQTLSDEFLKKLKFDGIQRKWTKKADDEIKKAIASILANTVDAKERAAQAEKVAAKAEEKKKGLEKLEQAKARSTEALKAASTKRPHEGDNNSAKPNKKFASDLAGTPSSSKLIPPKRPTNILANNLLGIASKPVPKSIPKKREPSPPSESRLSSILADIAKPPEPPKAPEAPPRAPETPEEKKRRERKESRRHLRVRFKDGPDLEQIRLFKHEQAEDEGRQDDMLRDAHDDRSEGMMHKKRVLEHLDVSLDDDEGLSGDMEDWPYPNLINLDLKDLDGATLFGPSYATRGGDRLFTTPEQETQKRREALELMVVYTNPDDIPPSPKEPIHTDFGGVDKDREVKGPTQPWLIQRLHEIQQYGPDYASQIFASRNHERKLRDIHEKTTRGVAAQSLSTPPAANINSILQQLGGPVSQPTPQQTAYQPKPAPTMDPQALRNLIIICESLKGKPYPPVEPPAWMTGEASRTMWREGYNRDRAAKDKQAADMQAQAEAHAKLQAAQYQAPPPPMVTQEMPIPSVQSFQTPVSQSYQNLTPQPPQLDSLQAQAFLASITNAQNGNRSTIPQYDFNAWSNDNGLENDYANEHQQSRRDGEWDSDNKRARASKQKQDTYNSNSKRGYEMKQWTDGPLDANGEYKGKKKPCKFWQLGKCAKGAKCTFLHDAE